MSLFASVMRRTCSDCASVDLDWFAAPDFLDVLPDPAQRQRAQEALDVFGSTAECWKCTPCSAWGVLGGF